MSEAAAISEIAPRSIFVFLLLSSEGSAHASRYESLMSNEFIAINHEVYTFRIPRAAIDGSNSAPVEVGSDFMNGQSGVLQSRDLWQMQMDIQTLYKAKVIPLGWKNYAAQRHEALRSNDAWRTDQRRTAKQKITTSAHAEPLWEPKPKSASGSYFGSAPHESRLGL